jgi:hypothetical protein
MARCFAHCQQRFGLSTCLSQIDISDILPVFNVQSKDRSCTLSYMRRSGYCNQKEYSVATIIRGNIQWLLQSEGILSG